MNTQRDRNFDVHAAPAGAAFPFQLHWNADQLTAAVPLRLHRLFDVDVIGEARRQPSANQPCPPCRQRRASYLPGNPMPSLFRVR